MSKGKDFEILIARIEKVMHNFPGVTIQHNVKLRTNYGDERQIDILLTEERGRFVYKTIIECKNTLSKVNVKTVSAFADLMRCVSAHQGIIVSASGFQRGAQNRAKESNIYLYQLSQVNEIENHLKSKRFCVYEIQHSNREIIVKFREAKAINNAITLHTELFSPHFNNKLTISEIVQDFLTQKQNDIASTFLRSVPDPTIPQTIKGTTSIAINFPLPIVLAYKNCFTEIIGFDGEIETNVTTGPSELKCIAEYKDVLIGKTHALVYQVEHKGETYDFIDKK